MGLTNQEWEEISDTYKQMYADKNREYGNADLLIMGRALQLALSLETESEGVESALLFYLLGKIARAISSNQRGESASDDTIVDIAIYSMMLSGVRQQRVGINLVKEDTQPESERC